MTTFTYLGHYRVLWPETTTFERSQGGYLHFWPLYFIVAKGHNISEVTEGYFPCEVTYSSLWPMNTSITKSEVPLQFGTPVSFW